MTRKEVLEALTSGVGGIRDDGELERLAWALSGNGIQVQVYELIILLAMKEVITTTEAVEILRR